LNQSRIAQEHRLPRQLHEMYSISVSFQAKIIKYALDTYVDEFARNTTKKLLSNPLLLPLF
jgi:hypothetical protein